MTKPQAFFIRCVSIRKNELIRESCSAFCASSLQNLAAVCSFHSLSETMLFLSLTFFRLVSKHSLYTSLQSQT